MIVVELGHLGDRGRRGRDHCQKTDEQDGLCMGHGNCVAEEAEKHQYRSGKYCHFQKNDQIDPLSCENLFPMDLCQEHTQDQHAYRPDGGG